MKNTILRYILLAGTMLAMCACAGKSQELVILHVNDTHSHLDPLRDGRCGVIERAAVIDSVRTAVGEENVLLLHAGDFNQGTSYYNVLGGLLEADIVNALRYDCITLGNHEFDNGVENLMERLAKIECPVVCANYDFSHFPGGAKITPSVVIEKAGYRIGIIGMLCDISTVVSRTISDRIPRVEDEVGTANRWAHCLRYDKACDIVIVLSHMGYEADCAFAAQSCDVDFIIGGHSHTFLDEPTVVMNKESQPVTIVQDGCWGEELGVLTVSRQ